MEDSQGYLWFGTHRGVSRFDGNLFTNYEPDSLKGSFVAAMNESKQSKRIWFATDQGVSFFEHNRFRWEFQDSLQKVLSILEDSKGRVWFGTLHRGLTVFYPNLPGSESSRYRHKPFNWDGPAPKRTVHALLEDHDGKIWLGRDVGLYYQDNDGIIKEAFVDQLPERLEVYTLFEDHDHRLWMGTDQGAFVKTGNTITHFSTAEGLPDATVFSIVEDADRVIWIGTRKGLVRMVGGKIQPFITAGTNTLPSTYSVRSTIIDREGNLWFGTEGFGVFKVTRSLFMTYGLTQGLSSNLTKSFLEDKQGRIWISTYDQGINVLQGQRVIRTYRQADGLAGEDIGFSYEARNGDFWFTSYTQGVSRFHNGRFEAYTVEDGLPLNRTFCVGEDDQNRIWIGTDFGIAIWDNGKIVHHLTVDSGLIDNTIYSIKPDSKGRMWIGTPNGFSIYDDGEIYNNAEVGNYILSFYEDKMGRMWMATNKGLVVSEADSFNLIRLGALSRTNNVVALASDDSTYLWIGTDGGVFRLNLESYSNGSIELAHFTRTDGLPNLEANANALYTDSKGQIWIGTPEGAARASVRVRKNSVSVRPKTNIIEVGTSIGQDWSEMGFETDAQSGLPVDLKVPYQRNRISFRFNGISLSDPNGVRYRYKLEGYDEDWSDPTHTTNASYNKLEPKAYTFLVKSASEVSDWDTEPSRFAFTIKPAFYQTAWFRIMAFLSVFLLIYIAFKLVSEQNKRKREEEQMKFRAEKLALEHQALYAMMNPHFTFNALQSIQYFIHVEDKKAASKFLSRFAKLVRKNLESTRSDFITLEEEVTRLDLYLSLEKMRFKDKFDYEVNVAPGVETHDTILPPMIFQPYVENSIKHGINSLSSGGLITVDISKRDEDHLLVIIRDNGIGITASKARRANRPSDHVSRGMQITRDRLALFAKMGGKEHDVQTKEIENPDGTIGGTEVTMLLPLQN
jgi:ligand-binding sensor domain-containing protein/two-component sensor histidine kinase